MLGGEFFHTGYHHVACDNELQGMCEKIGKYTWGEKAKLYHDHPVNTGWTNIDPIYERAYRGKNYEEDVALLNKRSELLGFKKRT